MEHYASSFSAGMKIEIKIPILHAKIFSDWAYITSIHEDLVSIQLSRDILPEGVILRVGQVLECRNINDNGCFHRAIVVNKGFAHELQLRLIGKISDGEQREFFRQDLFLPITCFSTNIQNTFKLQKLWEEKRKQQRSAERARIKRRLEEVARYKKQWRKQLVGMASGSTGVFTPETEQYILYDEAWNRRLPQAVNICGGGMSFVTSQQFSIDEYVLVEIIIPIPQRLIIAIAQVVFVNRNYAAGKDHEFFNTGVHFVFLEEGDRSAIVNYTTHIQLLRIRQAQGYTDEQLIDYHFENNNYVMHGDDVEYDGLAQISWKSICLVFGVLLLCGVGMMLILFLVATATEPLNGSGKNFGKGFETFKENLYR